MTTSDPDTAPAARQPPAGYLLTPFAWVRRDLAPLLAREPGLAAHLFTLDRARMHLVAFALAHVKGVVTPTLAGAILSASRRAVLSAVLGAPPPGLRGVFDRMPHRVMPRESYVRLSGLFADAGAAKLLSHADTIDERLINLLFALPPALRCPAIVRLHDRCHTLDGLPQGLAFLASRGAVTDADAFARQLGRCRNPRAFASIVRNAAEALPLPDTLPPPRIGAADRIDDPRQIRTLARRWRNCLANYVDGIDGGECAFYLWQSDDLQAGCLVRRRGRLGWFLEEIKGPRNREPSSPHLLWIMETFAAMGVPGVSAAEVIAEICNAADDRGRRGPGWGLDLEAEDVEMADDEDGAGQAGDLTEVQRDIFDTVLCANAWAEDTDWAEAA